jgi:hypothetical protein
MLIKFLKKLKQKAKMIELADVFHRYEEEYLKENKLPWNIVKAINAIKNCRTESLGGHIWECEDCSEKFEVHNSCRNRNCPKCQGRAREKWLKERKEELLPIGYFHVVFTVPHELNEIFQRNKSVMYNILFKSTSETLLTLSKDPKFLGAEIGFLSILHTWGQNLMDHYHIHNVVTGGGLSKDKRSWLDPKKEDFLIPSDLLSDLFKKKFLAYFERAKVINKLEFGGETEKLKQAKEFITFKNALLEKDWVTHIKEPFGSAEQVMEYLGRYTHRVAITNGRLRDIEDGNVSFEYKDYADESKKKVMKLKSNEFIRRFLLHILPDGFVKIRYYGLMSSKNKRSKLELCKKLLEEREEKRDRRTKNKRIDLLKELNSNQYICPTCKSVNIVKIQTIYPWFSKGP